MYKYNLYDNGELIFKGVRSGVIKNALGISHSRISNLVDTGTLYKGRYCIEREEETDLRHITDSIKTKQHELGEDLLREWDEVRLKFRMKTRIN